MSTIPHKRRRKSTKTVSDIPTQNHHQSSHHQPPNTPEDTDMDLSPDTHHTPTTSAPPSTPQAAPPLPSILTLPLEIRRQIYSHLLLAPPTHPILWPSAPLPPSKPRTLHPSILLTNRQINNEATSLLYTHNRFSFHHPSDCNIFSHIFAQPFAHLLSSVVFRMRDRPADIALWAGYFGSLEGERGLRGDLPGLSQLLIFVGQNWPGGGNLEPREAYEKWTRGYALRELRDSLAHVAQGQISSHELKIDQDDTSPIEGVQSRNSSAMSKETAPCDVCVFSSIRVGERVWESLAAALAGEGGVVTENPRGVLRGTVVGTVDEPVRVCLEVVCVGRERERM